MEAQIAAGISIHPNIISGAKLIIICPMLILALKQLKAILANPIVIITLFLLFCLLDYLDGTIALHRQLETAFGKLFDRLTDFPVLVAVSCFCIDILPIPLIATKLGLDLFLIIQHVMGYGNTENRIRTGINHTTLLALLIISQGWAPQFITNEFVIYLLGMNITFSAVIFFYNLGILQKRFIADAISCANLLCGIYSMIFAAKGRLDISLVFLMLGAAFDGFDGAAARKFGGTRWGVYSDDIADGVNYGIAPGVALFLTLGGIQGCIMGIFYSLFTISRLVYFTLNKADSDPNYFSGVPSTVGALVAICSLILFQDSQALLGLMIGIACIQMVSFDSYYRHLGRALAANRRFIFGIPVIIILLLSGGIFWNKEVPVAIILGISLVYGFIPTLINFKKVIAGKIE